MTDLGLENLSHSTLTATPRPAAAVSRIARAAGRAALGMLKVLVSLPEAYARTYSSLFLLPGQQHREKDEDY